MADMGAGQLLDGIAQHRDQHDAAQEDDDHGRRHRGNAGLMHQHGDRFDPRVTRAYLQKGVGLEQPV